MTLSLDTETTGVDSYHAARPFMVTIGMENGDVKLYEWDVDPLTRIPSIPPADLNQLEYDLSPNFGVLGNEDLVLQNAKFDITALAQVKPSLIENWPWSQLQDTLIAGHVLASNQPHNLTDMVMHYLGVDIEPYEKALERAVQECRRIVRSMYSDWKIAKAGLEGMPSAGEKTWKFDLWLPRAVAKHRWENSEAGRLVKSYVGRTLPLNKFLRVLEAKEGWDWRPPSKDYEGHHSFWTVTSDYATADSAATLHLWKVMEQLLRQRDLWEIYCQHLKEIRVNYLIENRGVSVIEGNLDPIEREFTQKSAKLEIKCCEIASKLGYELIMPKKGNNDSIREFCFGPKDEDGKFGNLGLGPLKLPVVHKTDTGNPSLDSKNAIPKYLDILPQGSPQRVFVQALADKSKYDTSIGYLHAYRRYWVEPKTYLHNGWRILHPNLNQTGTNTLRYSSNNPNIQNVSKKEAECAECEGEGCEECNHTGIGQRSLRYAFGPLPGRVWYAMDYENIELRIPAYTSGESCMIELFEKPNDPPFFGSYHLMNASIIYPDLFWPLAETKGAFKEKYASTWYQWCKNFGFAVSYGAMPESGTADRAANKAGAHMMVIDQLKEHAKLNRRYINFANKYGYVETLPDKTVNPRRGYPLNCTRYEYGGIKPTVPLNFAVQGTAMQCTRKAMVRCQEQLDTWKQEDGYEGYIALQVHDEMVFDLPDIGAKNLPYIKRLKQLMEQSGDDIGIPLTVSISYHPNNWSEKEKIPA